MTHEETVSGNKHISTDHLVNVLFVCSSIRALGTAAVDMCQVATGGADAYYHIGMHCWDIAASAIIVQEAGGVVMDTDGLYLTCDSIAHLRVPAGSVSSSHWSVCLLRLRVRHDVQESHCCQLIRCGQSHRSGHPGISVSP